MALKIQFKETFAVWDLTVTRAFLNLPCYGFLITAFSHRDSDSFLISYEIVQFVLFDNYNYIALIYNINFIYMYMFSIKVCLYVITLQMQVCIYSDQYFLFCAKFAFRICQLCHISGKTKIYFFFVHLIEYKWWRFLQFNWDTWMQIHISWIRCFVTMSHLLRLDTFILPNFACLYMFINLNCVQNRIDITKIQKSVKFPSTPSKLSRNLKYRVRSFLQMLAHIAPFTNKNNNLARVLLCLFLCPSSGRGDF